MSGTAKVLIKLEQNMNSGNYYEAYQMYTSVSQRYIKQKQFDAANELLADGCLKMLKHEQYGSVIDLIDRLLSLLGLMNLDLNDMQTMNNIIEIISAFPVEDQQFEPFIMKIIKWARQESVKVHHLVATIHYKLGNYYDAEYHYVRGDNQSAIMLGRMEYEFSLDKQQQDPGYYILRAVGALLLQAKVEEAETAYREFIKMNGWDNSQWHLITDHPLLNFTSILVQVVKNQDLESFCKATSPIQQTLSIDNYLVQMVDALGKMYFELGVEKPQPNAFADLLKSMFTPQVQSEQVPKAEPMVVADLDMD